MTQQQVDVVVLDIEMPDMAEAATLRKLREQYPDTAVLILTMHSDSDRILMMMQHKASGYLLKNRSATELVTAIRRLAQGGLYFPQEIRDTVFESHLPEYGSGPNMPALTEREEEVLRCIAKGHSAKMIADELHLTVHTANSHIKSLRQKIDVPNVQLLMRFACRNGYDRSN